MKQSKKYSSITKKSDMSITVIYHAISLTVLYYAMKYVRQQALLET